jgi:hypothetical protein
MHTPIVFADFSNADSRGRIRLNCAGSLDDISRQGLRLRDGMELIVHDEELNADGTAHY